MSNITLLDCTLRDGGYINDWEFGHNNIMRIYERLCDSGVDAVEVGFIDERRPYDYNRSIFPDTESIRKTMSACRKRPPIVLGMIDYGTCNLRYIEDADSSFIDGIRVIFKQHFLREALEYCGELKKKGYKVCAQLVSITTYSDEDLVEMSKMVNEIKPYAVSIVDTYGLLNPGKMLHIYKIMDKEIDEDIKIGFHAHNNLQLAFANTISFLEASKRHDVIVDGTLFGMGKSAGNAPIELLSMHLNENYGKNYNISSMLEAIEESINDFYARTPWGYRLFYYLSSKNTCHPSYVGQLKAKENLSVSDLDKSLSGIQPYENKLLYDKSIGEKQYDEFVQNNINDVFVYEKIKKDIKDKIILLIGPGKNIKLQKNKVDDYISKKKPLIISINFIPENIRPDYVFVTKKNRYRDMAESLLNKDNSNIKLIFTSNVKGVNNIDSVTVNRAPLLDLKARINDNSLLMFLKLLKEINVRSVALAGFDGYSDKESNYFNPQMEYAFIKDEAANLNRHMRDMITGEFLNMKIDFVTYSHYEDEEDIQSGTF